MSRTTLATAYENGELEGEYEFRNSWGFAPFVWDALCRKYEIGANEHGEWPNRYGPTMDDWMNLWKFVDDAKITPWEHNVLMSTYDDMVVLRDDMLTLAKSMRRFEDAFSNGKKACSLAEQAAAIEDAHGKGARFIAWNTTSVNEPWWSRYDEALDEMVYYNVDKGTKHKTAPILPLDPAV